MAMGGEPVWLRIATCSCILAQHFPPFWFCLPLTLPHIPVAKQQANQSWTTLLASMYPRCLKTSVWAIFFIFSMLLGAELQITNMFGNTFPHSFDKDPMFASSFIVQHASIIMSISADL